MKDNNRQTITRKVTLFPIGDKEEINRVYTYLRDGMYHQNKAMNQYMSALYLSEMENVSKDDRKELNNLYGRISTSKKGSAYTLDMEFAKGLPTGAFTMSVRNKFNQSVKEGLLYGKVSLPMYKKDNPLLIHVDYVRLRSSNPHLDNGLYHEYENHMEFLDHLYQDDLNVFLKFANGIVFKVVFGSPKKSHELRSVMKNIFEENYLVQGSNIQFDKTGKKIILNLCMSIPKREIKLDENVVVGVDLGLAIPAVCALNTNQYSKKSIGSKDDFLRVRTQLQAQRRRLQKSLNYCSGGHGREKKIRALERFKQREANFVQTYNHFVSKNVVDFAKENNAKYINIEDLKGFDTSKFILRNWSFYQLQEYITYKADLYGIEVRKINPYHTSQVCSCCGHWEEGQRVSQSEFICKNPNCKNFGESVNADFNAAKNIALSTDFR